ncbi:hypothetical protein RFI_00232 [Reticulomyxa filosa]|uniref:Uncharacterized protein n=1 Tax=Reticulomyxa filosa TaxID=46433 RepID=X6PFJ7_RETFI|nr:hypothetical protein RFI_00232 [Reticulomyxa filosa]|eukprot:ETO36829.1 hypothetical protein RFI_00232 [Reticulomyxa filosa]
MSKTLTGVDCDTIWCPETYELGLFQIISALQSVVPSLPAELYPIFATFLLGESWPMPILIKSQSASKIFITIWGSPHDKGSNLYNKLNTINNTDIQTQLKRFKPAVLVYGITLNWKLLNNLKAEGISLNGLEEFSNALLLSVLFFKLNLMKEKKRNIFRFLTHVQS